MMIGKKISVLIVDDSQSSRELLRWIVSQDAGMTVVGAAGNGHEAVEMTVRLRPDIVAMDVVMPEMDGLEATRKIMELHPVPIVIVSAIYDPHDAAQNFEALRSGALALLAKPMVEGEHNGEWRRFIVSLKAMSQLNVTGRHIHQILPASPGGREPPVSPKRAVLVGTSTGGPRVLATILSCMPADFPLPVLVVQHLAPGFLAGMVEWLGGRTALKVKIAELGEICRPGHVYFAPDGRHMGIGRNLEIFLSDDPPLHGVRPSASFLFSSAAANLGGQGIGVLLTGMGRDGSKELGDILAAGGLTVVESLETAMIHGMPGEAIRLGAAAKILPNLEIADYLVRYLKNTGKYGV
jgi:two-component system chemotaxis response regulator CheB